MSHASSVLTARFGSQPASSRRDEPSPERAEERGRRRGRRRGRGDRPGRGEETRPALKVKITKPSKRTEEEKTTEPANKTVSHRGDNQSKDGFRGAGTDSLGVDVFSFSRRPVSKAVNEKEKAKLAVLRTISRMLEENQLIRQRLTTANQAK